MVYNDAVTIYSSESLNDYGERTWGTGSAVKARVIEKSIETLDSRGNKIMSDLVVHLPIEEDADIGQKLEYDDIDYLILAVAKPKNEVGHTRDIKLLCKRYGEG
jgi:hypothetical protein